MEITIEDLCKELKERLDKSSCLSLFYIGEICDINDAIKRHEKEGYNETIPLAKGSHPIISKGEEYLIKFFKNSDLKDKLKNKIDNSVGSDKATFLYVSLVIKPQIIEELDDDDLDWPEIYTLKD